MNLGHGTRENVDATEFLDHRLKGPLLWGLPTAQGLALDFKTDTAGVDDARKVSLAFDSKHDAALPEMSSASVGSPEPDMRLRAEVGEDVSLYLGFRLVVRPERLAARLALPRRVL